MKYKQGDAIPLNNGLVRLILATWQVTDIDIDLNEQKSYNWYFCIDIHKEGDFSVDELSSIIRAQGVWLGENFVNFSK